MSTLGYMEWYQLRLEGRRCGVTGCPCHLPGKEGGWVGHVRYAQQAPRRRIRDWLRGK